MNVRGRLASHGRSTTPGFITRDIPKKGDVPAGQERYNRHVFYHELGTDPETDEKIFGEGRDAEDWPDVRLDNDGRMLLITVSQGWTKTELFLMDLKKGTPPTRITTGKNFLYSATVYNGRLYILTNEDAPRFRLFMAEAGNYERDDWTEIIPQIGRGFEASFTYGAGRSLRSMSKMPVPSLKFSIFKARTFTTLRCRGSGRLSGQFSALRASGIMTKFSMDSSLSLLHLRFTVTT